MSDENKGESYQAKDNTSEKENLTAICDKEKSVQADQLSGNHGPDQESNYCRSKEADDLLEASSVMTDECSLSSDKIGYDLLQLIERGQGLESWQGPFQSTSTDSCSLNIQMESVQLQSSISNAEMQSTEGSTVTLSVLNSTGNEDTPQSMSFPLAQHSSYNLLDHDYTTYAKLGYSIIDSLNGQVDASSILQFEQHPQLSTDQEKLLRMKRRKEKNRECSRQFRLKQKHKEEMLTKGKIEKSEKLNNLKTNVEKMKNMLLKISQQCSSCPHTAMLLNQNFRGNKENVDPKYLHELLNESSSESCDKQTLFKT